MGLSHPPTPLPHLPACRASAIAVRVSPASSPRSCTALARLARVRHGRRTRNAGGGVLLALPRPRLAAPQALHRGEDRLAAVTTAIRVAVVLTLIARG